MPGSALEIFAIGVADMLAENGSECKPRILSPHVQQADMRAGGDMAIVFVVLLTSDVVADRAARVRDSYGPTPALPLFGGIHRCRIVFYIL